MPVWKELWVPDSLQLHETIPTQPQTNQRWSIPRTTSLNIPKPAVKFQSCRSRSWCSVREKAISPLAWHSNATRKHCDMQVAFFSSRPELGALSSQTLWYDSLSKFSWMSSRRKPSFYDLYWTPKNQEVRDSFTFKRCGIHTSPSCFLSALCKIAFSLPYQSCRYSEFHRSTISMQCT